MFTPKTREAKFLNSMPARTKVAIIVTSFFVVSFAIIGVKLVYAQEATPFSIESIGSRGHQPIEGLAVNTLTGQCMKITEYYGSGVQPTIPRGWEGMFPIHASVIQTPFGDCRYNSGYPATCCNQLGLTYVAGEDPVILDTATKEIEICSENSIAQPSYHYSDYCKNKIPHIKPATVTDKCFYAPAYDRIVIDQQKKTCGLTYEATLHSEAYLFSAETLGTRYQMGRDIEKSISLCPKLEPVSGQIYTARVLGGGIGRGEKFCNLDKISDISKCCSVLGYTLVNTPAQRLVRIIVTSAGALIVLLFLISTHKKWLIKRYSGNSSQDKQ